MPKKSASVDSLTYENFAELLYSTFRVELESGPIELELVEAKAHRPRAVETQAPVANFSLVFRGPANSFLPQQTYQFEHDKLGTFDLFIVPIGKEESGYRYQAVFNRDPRT